MQSAAGRRAFSFLASKIHPQLPLSQRESEHLLSLLTTSFRAHLDSEHPVTSAARSHKNHPKRSVSRSGAHHASNSRGPSSQASASQHIEGILTNPLFATRPRRRGSDPTRFDTQEILRDPLSWFVDQVATGAADISKATMCLEMLQSGVIDSGSGASQTQEKNRRPGTQIAKWLKSSGLEHSREFIEGAYSLRAKLVPLLLQEGGEAHLWRWLTLNPQQLLESTSVTAPKILSFKAQLLKDMVASMISHPAGIDQAVQVFLRVYKRLDVPDQNITPKILQPAGAYLIDHIVANPHSPVSSNLYEPFLQSSKTWTGKWTRAVQSMLWLHHPTKPSARLGLSYITDPDGATAQIPAASLKRQQFLVQLCLSVARQLLAEERYAHARSVLEFTRENLPDLVGADPVQHTPAAAAEKKAAWNRERLRKEDENLALLNRLLPG